MLGKARVMDGFVIPDNIDSGEVEHILYEFSENDRHILKLCNSSLKRGWFGGVDEDDQELRQLDVLKLMARNYLLIKDLHGHDILPIGTKEKIETIGDGINEVFADL